MATNAKVQPNPWGDPKAPIAVSGNRKGPRAKEASPGPAEKPPTPAQATRQRYNMAGGE